MWREKMVYNFSITKEEKVYLRDLAKKYLEYANLKVMEERKKLWYEHNSLKGKKPMVVIEMNTFEEDMLPKPKCESREAIEIETNLMRSIINHELIDDDKVISPYYTIYWKIDIQPFGIDINRQHAKDRNGRSLGFKDEYPIVDLQRDFELLKPSKFSVDRDYVYEWKAFLEETIGDILPVKIKNSSLAWHVTPSQHVVNLMGLENMLYTLFDYPDEMHNLYNFIKDDIIAYIRWMEKEKLLVLNNENDFIGSGSYGFLHELPTEDCIKSGVVTSKDLWVNMNSQESSEISPDMFGEFIYPYYYELAKEFGVSYYGCCEPIHEIWDSYISKLPGLRKVSVSAWCDEEYIGNKLKESNVIYSRKPSPFFLGVGEHFDKEAFTGHIKKTLAAAKGGHLEFIYRDVYTLSGDINKPGNAVKIIRELIEQSWS